MNTLKSGRATFFKSASILYHNPALWIYTGLIALITTSYTLYCQLTLGTIPQILDYIEGYLTNSSLVYSYLIFFTASFVLPIFFVAALIYYTAYIVRNEQTTISASLTHAFKKLPILMLFQLLSTFITAIFIKGVLPIAIVIPIALIWTAISFYLLPILVLYTSNLIEAVMLSIKTFKKTYLAIIGFFLTFLLIMIGISFFSGLITTLLIKFAIVSNLQMAFLISFSIAFIPVAGILSIIQTVLLVKTEENLPEEL